MKQPNRWKQKWNSLFGRSKNVKKKGDRQFRRSQDDMYGVDQTVVPYFKAGTLFLCILALTVIFLDLGFKAEAELIQLNHLAESWILFGFALHYMLRLGISRARVAFLESRWFEGIVTLFSLFILADMGLGNSELIDHVMAGISHPEHIFWTFLKVYLLFIVLIKVFQYLPELIREKSNAGRFIIYSYLSVITSGTFLLMLPAATQSGKGLRFIDALFTTTSAVSVTGLGVVDTATIFTFFGKLVILIVIQIGGIGIILFASFIFLYLRGNWGIGPMNTIKDMLEERNTGQIARTIRRMLGFIFATETLGAIFLYFSWGAEGFKSFAEHIFNAIFLAISAFCNDGFTLFTGNLTGPMNATNIGVNLTTIALIVIGGLGFAVVLELLPFKTGRVSHRKRLSLHSRIVLSTTAVLIVAGTGLFLWMEWGNTLAGYSVGNKLLISLFQSVTTRTSGFSTVPTGAVGVPASLVLILLMFIGGSPTSTAGGIKTTTFTVLIRSIPTYIKGYTKMELFKRTISKSVIFRALTVLMLTSSLIAVSTILLSAIENQSFLNLLFEEVSAIGTVGLSRGITADLSSWGKFVIIFSMFMGRIGILTFMFTFAKPVKAQKYEYPEETVMVG